MKKHELTRRDLIASAQVAIRLAGLAGMMACYSEYEGVPLHVSHAVLTNLLRFSTATVSS